MNALLLAGCLGLIIRVPTLPDPVDLIEVNHVMDANGQETLVQLIFWDYRREHPEIVMRNKWPQDKRAGLSKIYP